MEEIICKAIKGKQILQFHYEGGIRIVEPHLLGEKTSGNIALSAYQIRGYSESRSVPFWRNYLLDKITDLEILDETFNSTRDGYNPNDKTMETIICKI